MNSRGRLAPGPLLADVGGRSSRNAGVRQSERRSTVARDELARSQAGAADRAAVAGRGYARPLGGRVRRALSAGAARGVGARRAVAVPGRDPARGHDRYRRVVLRLAALAAADDGDRARVPAPAGPAGRRGRRPDPRGGGGDRCRARGCARHRPRALQVGGATGCVALSGAQRTIVPRPEDAGRAAERDDRRAATPRPTRRRPEPARPDVRAWPDRAGGRGGPSRPRGVRAGAGRVPYGAVAGGFRQAGAALVGASAGRLGGGSGGALSVRADAPGAGLRRAGAGLCGVGRAAGGGGQACGRAGGAGARAPDRAGGAG